MFAIIPLSIGEAVSYTHLPRNTMVNLKKSEKFQKKQEINTQRLVHFFPVSDIFENQLILLIDRRKQLIHIRVQIRLICRVKNNRNIRFPIGILAQQCQTGARCV